MKAGTAYRVPLSDAALNVLERAWALDDGLIVPISSSPRPPALRCDSHKCVGRYTSCGTADAARLPVDVSRLMRRHREGARWPKSHSLVQFPESKGPTSDPIC